MTAISEYVASRELMRNLTLRELRSKYKRSALGWGWSLLNPLATMAIYTLVFRYFLRIEAPRSETGLKNFALYLLCALLPWNFVILGVTGSIGSLVANSNLIKKTYFPRELLVASQVASWDVSFLIELSLLAVALLLFGNMVLPWLPIVIGLVLLLTLLVMGLALAFSVLNVFFRDVQHFVGIFFQIWFYLTPIIYPLSLVPQRANIGGFVLPVRRIYDLNPLVHFVQAFRAALYELDFPDPQAMAYISVFSVVTFLVGLWLFGHFEGRLAEEL